MTTAVALVLCAVAMAQTGHLVILHRRVRYLERAQRRTQVAVTGLARTTLRAVR